MPNLLRVPRLNPTLVPAVPVEVDWSHPLARGLTALYAPGSRNELLDIAGVCPPLRPIDIAQNLPVATAAGVGWQASTATGAGLATVEKLPPLDFSAGGTMWTWRYRIGNPTVNTPPWIISIDSLPDGHRAWTLYSDIGSNNLVNFQNNTLNGAFGASVSPTTGFGQVATTFEPSASTFAYINGVRSGSVLTSQPTLGFNAATDSLGLGWGGNQITLAGGWWTRPLSGDETAWLSTEPFAMLRPIQPRRRFVQVGGYPPLTMGLAVDLAPAALDAHAAVATSADFAAPLADAAFAAALASAIAADSAATLAAADLAASADSTIAADFAGSAVPATLDGAAHSTIAAAGAATLAPATLDASAVSAITAAFSAGLATATLAATITVGIGTRVANLAATLAPATIAATMTSIVSAGVSAATAPATVSASTVAAIAAEAVVVVRPADLTASAASAIDAAFVVALAAAALDGTITVAGAIVWPVTVRVGRMIALPAVRRSVSVPVSRRMISIPD